MSNLQPPPPRPSRWRRIPARFAGPIYTVWGAGWITAFALGHSEIGLPMMFATAVIPAVVETSGRRGRRGRRGRSVQYWGRPDLHGPPQPTVVAPQSPPQPAPTASPERRLAAAVIRAETNRDRVGERSLALVRELDALLRPMLAGRDAVDPAVRHDVEAIAADHLPAVLDAYLAVPADAAHERLGTNGATPADELRSQLTLLVEGCTQLRDAIRAVDVSRQQELGRFLDAKFGRSDLTL